MQRELVATNALPRAAGGDDPFGERRRFARREHPPDDGATEDVEDDTGIVHGAKPELDV